MVEESKSSANVEQRRLQDANINRLERLMQKEMKKPLKERRLLPKNIKMSSYC